MFLFIQLAFVNCDFMHLTTKNGKVGISCLNGSPIKLNRQKKKKIIVTFQTLLFYISKRVSYFKSTSWWVTECITWHMLHQSTVKIVQIRWKCESVIQLPHFFNILFLVSLCIWRILLFYFQAIKRRVFEK